MLPFKEDGYNFWTWRGHKIHYVVQGSGPPVVLVHGFGASAFHWRSISLSFFIIFFDNTLVNNLQLDLSVCVFKNKQESLG